MDVSLRWLYAEYTNYLEEREDETDTAALENYNCCIQMIFSIVADRKCLTLMSAIIKQAPLLTDRALLMIRDLCDQDEENAEM